MALKVSKHILLVIIVAIAFTYRFALMTMNGFPPGADIGLHESVIKSITAAPTNFFWNDYHMGSGLSLTNPGYHIFAAFIITMTGLTDYLAQALVATLYSTLIVVCAFLITRRIWGNTPAFIVAILTTFSASDIVMLSWAGYPNIITLSLIPIIFYLFLKPEKLGSKSYFVVASILVSAVFLTHIFSALIFGAITASALLVCVVFWKRTDVSRHQAFSWLLPIGFGALLVSPYLAKAIPIYFSSEGTITGAVAATIQAVLETRLIPLEIVCLSLASAFLFFVFSKFMRGKSLTVSSVLFAAWILVPVFATQSYLFGVYLDYERFLYFLSLPIIVCVALIIVSALKAVLGLTQKLQNSGIIKTNFRIQRKGFIAILLSVLVGGVLLTPLFALPVSYNPQYSGIYQTNFFQVMNLPEYQAIQWIKNNTPEGSVCVSDAGFGWWLSGFAQRPTLSAVKPQYLILQHEIEPAAVARNLLVVDYIVDNGLIQVKQSGAYSSDSTHEIYAVLSNSQIRPLVFSLNDTQIGLLYRDKGVPQELSLSGLTDSKTSVISNENSASFLITRENEQVKLIEEVTIFRGANFAQVSFTAQRKTDSTVFDWLHVPFQSGEAVTQYSNTITIVDNTLHLMNQLVFPGMQLGIDVLMQQNADNYELVYNLQGNSTSHASFFVGLSQLNPDLEANQPNYLNSFIVNNTQNYLKRTGNLPLNCFDYQEAIQKWNISYIAIRDFTQLPRFSDDPLFSLAFKNDRVAIFKIAKS
jgi:hypothetical protein